MCGRTTHFFTWREIYEHLDGFLKLLHPPSPPEGPEPSYNVPPTANIPSIRSDPDAPTATTMLWWLIPSWSKTGEVDHKFSTFNARSESAASKPTFRGPFTHRRCVLPVSGFYEWKPIDSRSKQPYFITRADDEPLYLAGLWDRWGDKLESCTILTTDANAEMQQVHHRMPCVLEPEELHAWLDVENTPAEEAQSMLRPAADGTLQTRSVSPRVGNTKNNDPDLLRPADQGLFQ